MDLHILIVIACVFLASLGSLLFINKFLRRETFEEIIAEKKALSEKILGKGKASLKKPKKQPLKKVLKREKKQRQREQVTTTEQEDSDFHSEQASIDEEPLGLSKSHVEFEPVPEVVTYNNNNNKITLKLSSTAEKENLNKQTKGRKDKKLVAKSSILIHRNVQNTIKENSIIESFMPSNQFENKIPKDAVELKKTGKKEEKSIHQQHGKKEKTAKKGLEKSLVMSLVSPTAEEPSPSLVVKDFEEKVRQNSPKALKQKNKQQNRKKELKAISPFVSSTAEESFPPLVVKDLEEKIPRNSPKAPQQKNKQQNRKKELKDAVVGLEKLSESDTIGVSLLMNLFRRAELNRSEIQILIDYLLNRQQDMPSTHSEWSDDICQKLKRQLEEKEKALVEEQEASIGIQVKLRELRSEINTERAAMNNTIKSYVEKIQAKDQDIALLEQKIKTLNDNLSIERQQFQAKLLHEKQSGSQDLLSQLQIMQNEIAHKDKCISELTCIVNASRQAVEESQQKNEIIQSQVQQICTLEQQRDELEQVSNNRIFELEKAKQLESEINDAQVEIRNLQNALESVRGEVNQKNLEIECLKNELNLVHNKGMLDKQQEITNLQANNAELKQQLLSMAKQTQELSGLQNTIESLKSQITEKEQQLIELETINSQIQQQLSTLETSSKRQATEHVELKKLVEILRNDVTLKSQQLQCTEKQAESQRDLQKLVESLKKDVEEKELQLQDSIKQTHQQAELQNIVSTLKADVFKKDEQLQEVKKEIEKMHKREKELLQQLQEQKDKNNDLRTKNWKLVDALQNAEAKVTKQSSSEILVQQAVDVKPIGGSIDSSITGKHEKHVRDLLERLCPDAVKACAGTALSISFSQWLEQVLSTHVKQQRQQQGSSIHKSTQSNSLENSPILPHSPNANGSRECITNVTKRPSEKDTVSNNSDLLKENSLLRIRIDELTKLANKTENTLSDLMKQSEQQDEKWRNIIHSKDEQIKALQHSNGQGDI